MTTITGLEPARSLATTRDVFLGNKVFVRQPVKGYRAGIDAVLLAASVAIPEGQKARVLDAGAGAGTVGLCVAARLEAASVVLYERAPELVVLARGNIADNGFSGRVDAVCGDVAVSNEGLSGIGLQSDTFDAVLANPPFHDAEAGTRAADPLKDGSHAMGRDELETWVRFLARMAKPGGSVAMIHKAEALGRILSAFEGRFGGLEVLPIAARAGEPAIRVLVKGIKGSRAPMVLKPPFVLHDAGQAFTAPADAILRHGGGLDFEN